MARNIGSTEQTLLAGNPFRTERLVEIQTPGGSYYFTTGQHDVAVDTGTSGGSQTFIADNGIKLNGVVREYYTLAINEISIDIGDVENTYFDNLIRPDNNYDFTNTEVNIYLLFRDPTSGSAYVNNLINLYKGAINKINVTRTTSANTINISVTNKFGNFDKIVGRRTSNFTDAATAGQINWGNIRSI